MYCIIPEYKEWNVGGEDPNDSWSRDSFDGEVTGVTVSSTKDYNGVGVESLPAYAVVVGYTTGDTFGHNFTATVVDAFETYEEAQGLAQEIDRVYGVWEYGTRKPYEFEFNGKEYYASWNGYFEHLESVDVFPVEQRFSKKY
jgi:hypothetical protein